MLTWFKIVLSATFFVERTPCYWYKSQIEIFPFIFPLSLQSNEWLLNYGGLSIKEYWLYKEIEHVFRLSVDPKILSSHLKPWFTAEEMVQKIAINYCIVSLIFNFELKRNIIRCFYLYGLILAQTQALFSSYFIVVSRLNNAGPQWWNDVECWLHFKVPMLFQC